MEVLGIILVIVLFVVGMIGTIYPVLPGVFAIYAALSRPLFSSSWLLPTMLLVHGVLKSTEERRRPLSDQLSGSS